MRPLECWASHICLLLECHHIVRLLCTHRNSAEQKTLATVLGAQSIAQRWRSKYGREKGREIERQQHAIGTKRKLYTQNVHRRVPIDTHMSRFGFWIIRIKFGGVFVVRKRFTDACALKFIHCVAVVYFWLLYLQHTLLFLCSFSFFSFVSFLLHSSLLRAL